MSKKQISKLFSILKKLPERENDWFYTFVINDEKLNVAQMEGLFSVVTSSERLDWASSFAKMKGATEEQIDWVISLHKKRRNSLSAYCFVLNVAKKLTKKQMDCLIPIIKKSKYAYYLANNVQLTKKQKIALGCPHVNFKPYQEDY